MSRSNLIDITVSLLHQTERAVLVTTGMNEDAVWIPKSRCEIAPAAIGGLWELTLPEPLAIEKGLV